MENQMYNEQIIEHVESQIIRKYNGNLSTHSKRNLSLLISLDLILQSDEFTTSMEDIDFQPRLFIDDHSIFTVA